ncbi:MAG: hypothetical protein CVU57_04270 [Deltaproteobacteria bacterium HGW-Deltaproteobacteria-15]|jgi:hypothetical protein|nr:MAG: hypothetical protein CVU57_04270 [Deltaproteobacteria bacterium HGW-Deltaproteobacteria-15]
MNKYMAIAMKLLPTILQLMGIAESLFEDKPNSGKEKKAVVTTAAKAIVEGVGAVSTGGQAETWERIKDPVSNIIDNAAAIAFPEHTK